MVNKNIIQFDFNDLLIEPTITSDINSRKGIDFNDLLIEPAITSDINSRKGINIFDENGFLKIFTAPMFDVVSEDNYQEYLKNKIYTILPRKKSEGYTEEYILSSSIYKFISVGLVEFEKYFLNVNTRLNLSKKVYILIDIANGHMQLLLDYIKKSKLNYGENLVLMVGNIANPDTYIELSEVGADYVRVGIGFGSGCTTSANGAIGYSMASLIDDINELKKAYRRLNYDKDIKFAKIIADGGIKLFSDIIKAFGLGCDYVMLGGIFNKCFESSGEFFYKQNDDYKLLSKEKAKNYFDREVVIYKQYRGMSTKLIQKELGREKLTTSEGIRKYNQVEYYLASWVENFSDYLKTSLSYTGKNDIKYFIGNVTLNLISNAAFNRYNK